VCRKNGSPIPLPVAGCTGVPYLYSVGWHQNEFKVSSLKFKVVRFSFKNQDSRFKILPFKVIRFSGNLFMLLIFVQYGWITETHDRASVQRVSHGKIPETHDCASVQLIFHGKWAETRRNNHCGFFASSR